MSSNPVADSNSIAQITKRIQEQVSHQIEVGTDAAINIISSVFRTTREKTIEVAKKIVPIAQQVMKAIGTTLLFLTNSSLFVIGAVAASIFPDQMQEGINRISRVFGKERSWPQLAGIALAAVLAWPIFLACASFFAGGNLALTLQKN
jgi:hypothetical protein